MPVAPKTISWDDATLPELKIFAANSLGMHNLAGNIGEAALRSKIRVAYAGDSITILLDEFDDELKVSKAKVRDSGADSSALAGGTSTEDPLVWITIAAQEGDGGHRAVYTNVNGVAFLIPRGKSVPIPYRYYLALKNAVKTDYIQDMDTDEMIEIDVLQYPFSVDQPVDPAAAAAWHKRDEAA